MLDGYHQVFWRFAGQEVRRRLDMPHQELAVDLNETTYSIPILTEYQPVNRGGVPVIPPAKDREAAAVDGIGDVVTPDQFPHTGWFGEYGDVD